MNHIMVTHKSKALYADHKDRFSQKISMSGLCWTAWSSPRRTHRREVLTCVLAKRAACRTVSGRVVPASAALAALYAWANAEAEGLRVCKNASRAWRSIRTGRQRMAGKRPWRTQA